MADQLSGLGVISDMLLIDPDWSRDPAKELEISRTFFEFPGTQRSILLMTDDAPAKIELDFTFTTKAEANEFLAFYADRRGMWGKFWLPSPANSFTLHGDHQSGDTVLYVEKTSFLYSYQGRERIYLLKTDGSLLTFKITDVLPGLDDSDPLGLRVGEPLAEQLLVDEVERFGFLFFVRFDQDDLDVDFRTDSVISHGCRFSELVKEYPA